VNLLSYLFGSLLSVTDGDILSIGALAVISLAVLALTWRHLAYMSFDEDSARVAGLPTERLNLTLMLLTAASVVAGMRIVGILMVSTLLVVPAAAAITVARSFRQTMALSLAFSAVSVVVGLAGAFYLNVAAGGAVALTQVIMFFIAVLAFGGRG
jgi:zinc transport system permease protein